MRRPSSSSRRPGSTPRRRSRPYPSVLPLPLLGGPDDRLERIDGSVRSLHRLAPFHPGGIVCLTGTGSGRDPDDARAILVDGLRYRRRLRRKALGLKIGLEPYQREGGEPWTIASSIPEAVQLIEEAGDPPALGIQFDAWHLWNTPTLEDDIQRELGRFVGVHVSDSREPTRGWADRVLPGDGVADVPRILAMLDQAGWDGSTTSRSSRTTAPSAPRSRTRSGPCRRPSCCPAPGPRSTRPGRRARLPDKCPTPVPPVRRAAAADLKESR